MVEHPVLFSLLLSRKAEGLVNLFSLLEPPRPSSPQVFLFSFYR